MALYRIFLKYIFLNFFQSIGSKPLPSIPKDVVDDDLLFNDEIDYINKQNKLPEVSAYKHIIHIKKFLDYYMVLLGKL